MLIYTYKLDSYIKKKILPQLLLLSGRYSIKGSFKRKVPYITDIDVVNTVHDQINNNNIYDELQKLIKRLQDNNLKIILLCITCGNDERFNIKFGNDEEMEKIFPLLEDKEISNLKLIMQKYSHDTSKRLFYINEFIWNFYKIRWTVENIMENKIILRGGLEVKFTDIIKDNSHLLLQYYIMIGSHPLGIDISVVYKKINLKSVYLHAADYLLKLSNYSKEYYFMLFPLKYYFKKNKKIENELENIIEKKFGLYKQLLVRIDSYHTLYISKKLEIYIAKSIIINIINDLKHLPNFSSNVINKIKEVSINNSPCVKMEKWDILLNILYDELNLKVNMLSKKIFFKYLDLVPENEKNKFLLQY